MQYFLDTGGRKYLLNLLRANISTLDSASSYRMRALGCASAGHLDVLHFLLRPPPLSPKSYPPAEGAPYNMTAIVVLLNLCSESGTRLQNPNTPQAINQLLFGSASDMPGSVNLKSLYNSCSHGKVQLSPDCQVIGPLDVPCTGPNWDSLCDNGQYFAWGDWALQYINETLQMDLSSFAHHVFLLGPSECAFAGMGELGCATAGQPCRAWIDGRRLQDSWLFTNWFHEVGHNLHLDHSNGPYDEPYQDYTCPMGSGGPFGCYNPARQWAIGWSQPLAVVNYRPGGSEEPGRLYSYQLSPDISGPVNHIQVHPPTSSPALFISYRVTSVFDQSLPPNVDEAVYIVQFAGGQGNEAYGLSQILTPNGVSSGVTTAVDGILISVSTAGLKRQANVTVCRYLQDPAECTPGATRPPPPRKLPPRKPPPRRPPPPTPRTLSHKKHKAGEKSRHRRH